MTLKKRMRTFGKMEVDEHDAFSKMILVAGEGEEKPNEGSVCVYDLSMNEGKQPTEEELGSYKFGTELTVSIGEGDCFIADFIDKTLLSMTTGEMAYIRSKIGMNGQEIEKTAPGNKQFKFTIHLKSFQRATELSDLDNAGRLEKAAHHKNKGTDLFKQNKLDEAMNRYRRSLKCLGTKEESNQMPTELPSEHQMLFIQCHSNLAAALLKKDDFRGVIKHSSVALAIDQKNVKSLYRRGQAYLKLSEHEEAQKDFNAVIALEPHNAAAKKQIALIDTARKKEKQIYQKMFG